MVLLALLAVPHPCWHTEQLKHHLTLLRRLDACAACYHPSTSAPHPPPLFPLKFGLFTLSWKAASSLSLVTDVFTHLY